MSPVPGKQEALRLALERAAGRYFSDYAKTEKQLDDVIYHLEALGWEVKSKGALSFERSVRDQLVSALGPLAALKVPFKPQGNAGAYSIRFDDITAAKAAIAGATNGR